MYAVNSVGERHSPCITPLDCGTIPLSPADVLTWHFNLLNIFCIRFSSFVLIWNCFNVLNKVSLYIYYNCTTRQYCQYIISQHVVSADQYLNHMILKSWAVTKWTHDITLRFPTMKHIFYNCLFTVYGRYLSNSLWYKRDYSIRSLLEMLWQIQYPFFSS